MYKEIADVTYLNKYRVNEVFCGSDYQSRVARMFFGILFVIVVSIVGCDRKAPPRSAWDISWQEVRHWSDLSTIVGRRAEIDEVVYVSPDQEYRLFGDDAQSIVGGLAEQATHPIIDVVSLKVLGNLVLRAQHTDLATIQCYEGNIFSFKDAYIRSNRDVLRPVLTNMKRRMNTKQNGGN
jgi:hypothetical protein